MKVGAHASFDEAVFAGPADFTGADISGDFVAVEAQFTHAEQPAIFSGMRVAVRFSSGNSLCWPSLYSGRNCPPCFYPWSRENATSLCVPTRRFIPDGGSTPAIYR